MFGLRLVSSSLDCRPTVIAARSTTLTRLSLAAACVLALGAAFAGFAFATGSGGVSPGEEEAGVNPSGGAFPVAAKHAHGDGLGAGRGHQGQDLLAGCGKPVVAAQPGRVKVRRFQARGAGRYLVIDGRGKLNDTVYMHMPRRAGVSKGTRVKAGDVIGRVGTTGRSSACHLHFEIWARGWAEGRPLDPKPYLRRWDRRH